MLHIVIKSISVLGS